MIGQTISQYKIEEKLGEGGMGIVYKAHDTKLDRFVALKFLPPHMAASEQDKARFIQEAKSAAALNHPNVCSIIDIQEHDGQIFIVMEFVDGQTLMEKKSSIPLKQAIEIGIQIADGLAVAHEKGIIHRDIKPENIMVRKDGIVQIMDFGLAKLAGTSRLTKMGSTVGTLGYMSPEQVQGLEADHRSDIFSLGVLLYEMITGRSPFNGSHESAILYEIVNVDVPPMVTVKPELDPALDAIVLECLEKDPSERFQSIAEVAKELRRFKRESSRSRASRVIPVTGVSAGSATPTAATTPMQRLTSAAGWLRSPMLIGAIAAVPLLLVLLLIIFPDLNPGAPQREVFRAFMPAPPLHTFSNTFGGGQLALSHDGRELAFIAIDSQGTTSLWVRPLSSLVATELPGTTGAGFPFWSPDDHYIGFFSNNKLKKIERNGGPTFTICDVVTPRGASWGANGKIVLPTDQTTGLSIVSENGGIPVTLTSLDTARKEQTHRYPSFLPDGKHFLFFARTTSSGSGSAMDAICVGSVNDSNFTRIMPGISNIAYASGHLLFMRENTLMAQRFDADALKLSGEPIAIAEAVDFSTRYSIASFTVSANGKLIFLGKSPATTPELALFSPERKKLGSFGQPEVFVTAQLSKDGRTIAMDLYELAARNSDIWLYDIGRNVKSRFTFDGAVDAYPVWSPDSKNIVFSSNRRGHFDLYMKPANGATDEQPVYISPLLKNATDWSKDGRYLLFTVVDPQNTKSDVYYLPMFGDRKPVPFVTTEFNESNGAFSPDGHWVAYQSNESGRSEVYVRPFPGPGAKWQVSANGGNAPRWKSDGRTIYYVANGKIFAVDVREEKGNLIVGKDREHFDPATVGGINVGNGILKDISPDGNAILLSISRGMISTAPMTLVVNWDEELGKK